MNCEREVFDRRPERLEDESDEERAEVGHRRWEARGRPPLSCKSF